MGGAAKLAEMLRSDVTQGLPEGDDLEERAKEFGRNWVRLETKDKIGRARHNIEENSL